MNPCINRIRLEFKDPDERIWVQGEGVLIESDWNLKFKTFLLRRARRPVLIESDWNLKMRKWKVRYSSTGINRIRLEFKEEKEKWTSQLIWVLIESDWNLKGGHPVTISYPDQSINRIRLEFKGSVELPCPLACIRINRIRLEFKDTIMRNLLTDVLGY